MITFKRTNNILGWMVFLVSAVVYLLTIEPSVSLWDCGEFIATSYKLQIGHPPGAPLFMIIARFFSLFAGEHTERVAMMVNAFSALSSAFTILFLYWIITHLAFRLISYRYAFNGYHSDPEQLALPDKIIIMGCGVIGALAYTFSDTFWFSAVEGEVYASSSLFTAIVFWAVLKWENEADHKYANRWLILISYLMGLSIGVHLLNLLAIPAIVMVYYFRKNNVTAAGISKALIISFLMLASMMYIMIPGVIWLASRFELLFVNGFGLPYHSGVIFYFLALFGLLGIGLWKTYQTRKIAHTILLIVTVVIIGYSSYAVIVLRSMANPPMDENNPETIFSLQYYLNREQYGDRPLISGQYFNAPTLERLRKGKPTYSAIDGKYKITSRKLSYSYDHKFKTLFPRMWSSDNDHVDVYLEWGGISESQLYHPKTDDAGNIMHNDNGQPVYDRNAPKNPPGFYNNLKFFLSYQVGHMYLRYFMWNFAGRQNDVQGYGDPLNGNWITGINAIDRILIGNPEKLPERDKNDPSRNTYFFLPLLLGLFGLIFHMQRDVRNFWVVTLLFILTGLAIVVYLNQTPLQPRERDYAYAGSFFAFSIWIGLGVLAIYETLSQRLKNTTTALLVSALCFCAVPAVMAAENWDDHDRSGRYTTRDLAYDYLMSCAPNAILFTSGDNDTFPLWYAQEVEGIRTDVRVVNLMLLNMDWHIDQIKRKAYESEALPVSLKHEQYVNGTRDVLFIQELIKEPADLKDIVNFISSDLPEAKVKSTLGDSYNFIPTRQFRLPVDTNLVLKNGTVSPRDKDKIVPALEWTFRRNNMGKSAMVVLDILAHNNWERPIYFASIGHEGTLGLENYMQLEGFAYRLVPIYTPGIARYEAARVESNLLYENLMNKFRYGGIPDSNVYLDDFHIRTLSMLRLRTRFVQLATTLINEADTAKALKVLDRCLEIAPDRKVPFDYTIVQVAASYYKCKEVARANSLIKSLADDADSKLSYYLSQRPNFILAINDEIMYNFQVIQQLVNLSKTYNQSALSQDLDAIADKHYKTYYGFRSGTK